MPEGRTRIVTDEAMLGHRPGSMHPERPERLAAILELLRSREDLGLSWTLPAPLDGDAIKRVHHAEYVDRILALRGQAAALDPDTMLSPKSVDAALLAAGATWEAVRGICQGEAANAFALVRPPGHHAEADRAMGFCIFNNVAVAAQLALDAFGYQRVAIVDWDVHHGNGTQHIFEERADVFYASTHRFPFYPGTGAESEKGRGKGEGFTLNVPLRSGDGDLALESAFDDVILPRLNEYAPDLVLVSAGFDAHRSDPLGGLEVSTEAFARLTQRMMKLANDCGQGRIALVLEGGYDLSGLAHCVLACIEALNASE
jgi:acetoin utilization deacetylase AcuC-like enzyme